MSYVALYREFRPQSFSEVVGQEHITRTLKNAILQGRLAHAYLFCGPRGTGKTTIAKILAKAVNCQTGWTSQPALSTEKLSLEGGASPSGEPCNRCETCRRITEGTSMDVLEIDAASNRGIDEIRDLRDKVKYAPAGCRYKVYIIDEVHMLTTEAFNALLKTLEEPPGHALFILATTDPQKVPLTVLSRCQRFDFHRFTSAEITARLREVVAKSGITAEEEALSFIARGAEGGMRDALSLLDQVISFCGNEVTLAGALSVLGTAPYDLLADVTGAMARRDSVSGLKIVHDLVRQGRDVRQFLRDLMAYLRNLLLVKVCRDPGDLLDLPPSEEPRLKELAGQFSVERISGVLKALAEADNEIKWASQPRLLLEMTLIKIARTEEFNPAVPDARPDATLNPGQQPAQQPGRQTSPPPKTSPNKPGRPEPIATTTKPESSPPGESAPSGGLPEDIRAGWASVLDRLRKENVSIHAFVVEGSPLELRGDNLLLAFRKTRGFHRDRVAKPEIRAQVEKAMEGVYGRKLRLTAVLEEDRGVAASREDIMEHPDVRKALELFGGEIVEIRDD